MNEITNTLCEIPSASVEALAVFAGICLLYLSAVVAYAAVEYIVAGPR